MSHQLLEYEDGAKIQHDVAPCREEEDELVCKISMMKKDSTVINNKEGLMMLWGRQEDGDMRR